jgi:hypothetical protein
VLQRLIAAVLGVLGLAAIALGIASATAWRGDDTLTADADAAKGTTLVTTAPGVLELGGDAPVTVRASADAGTKVVVAVGRDTDVDGWVGTDAHTVVTGLADWHTLTTDDVAATGAPVDPATPAAAPDPDGSDLWVLQSTGDGAAELTWTPQEGRWTVLVAATGDAAAPPAVELSWPRAVTTPWLLPGVLGGAVLLLLGLLLAFRLWRAARRPEAAWHPVVTGATPVVGPDTASDDAPTVILSRREIREAAASAAAAARTAPTLGSRIRGLGTGEMPTVPHAGGSTAVPLGSAAPADGQADGSGVTGAEGPASPGAPGTGPIAGAGGTLVGRPAEAGQSEAGRPAGGPAGTPGPAPRAADVAASGPATTAPAGGPAARPDATATPGAQAAGTSNPGAESRASVGTPPPGRPGSAAGPRAADPAASAPPATPPAAGRPVSGTPTAPGVSRADAWRRAWGFPGTTPDTSGPAVAEGADGDAAAPDSTDAGSADPGTTHAGSTDADRSTADRPTRDREDS